MRVPLSWLREFVDIDLTPEQLAERLTLLGMEVKTIERWGADWEQVVTGELVTVEKHPRAEEHMAWQLDTLDHAHFQNTPELTGTLERLVQLSRDSGRIKDVLATFTIQEMLVRLMQTQARQLIFHNYAQHLTSHRFAAVVQYIKQHLTEQITVEKLSELACMSKATFFRVFKREFGITPVEFIIRERLGEAKRLLRHPLASVAEVCLRAGFNNLSYFQALFKKYEGVTPGAYKKQMVAV